MAYIKDAMDTKYEIIFIILLKGNTNVSSFRRPINTDVFVLYWKTTYNLNTSDEIMRVKLD